MWYFTYYFEKKIQKNSFTNPFLVINYDYYTKGKPVVQDIDEVLNETMAKKSKFLKI